MKKRYILAVLFLLIALVSAGCRNRGNGYDTPSTTTSPTTVATTATAPSTVTTEAPSTQETIDRGNGPLESSSGTNASDGTESTIDTQSAAPRSRMPDSGTDKDRQSSGSGR